MLIIPAITEEYRRYQGLAEKALAQVDDATFFTLDGEVSIAVYVKHVGGNLHSRFTDFLTSDGEKPWRNRDGEFDFGQPQRAELMEVWRQGWSTLFATLGGLSDGDLGKTVKIRGADLTVALALARSLAHTAYHSGQIVLLAKSAVGGQWKNLTMPRVPAAR